LQGNSFHPPTIGEARVMTDTARLRRRSAQTVQKSTRRPPASLVWLVFAGGLALSPFADYLSIRGAHGFDATGSDARYSLFVRGSMVAGLLLLLLANGRVKLSSWRTALLALVAIVASIATCAFGNMSSAEFAQQAVFVLKVFAFFVCLAALSGMSDRRIEKLDSIVRFTLFAYALAIVAGALFSIDMFRSYWADTQIRSGYKGIVYAQNEASALMIVGLSYGLLRVLKSGWSVSDGALVGSIVLASCLVGTKAAIAGAVAMTCSYFFCRHRVPQATLRALTLVAVLVCVALAAYFLLPGVRSAVDLSLRYFAYQHDHARDGGALTMVLSGRDVKFSNVWDQVAKEDYIPLIMGGYPVVRYLVEIDVPDLVLAMGLPVGVFYFWGMGKAFLYRESGTVPRFGRWFYIVLMATACTAGHVLVSAIVSPYLAMIAVQVKRAAEDRRANEKVGQ
jgi:hypothetical protein